MSEDIKLIHKFCSNPAKKRFFTLPLDTQKTFFIGAEKVTNSGNLPLAKTILSWRLLFVYGTLMYGFHNNTYLDNVQLLGTAVTKNKYSMSVDEDNIPRVALRAPPAYPIFGELYEIGEDMTELDDLEQGYTREYISVVCNGKEYVASVYFGARDNGIPIPFGDYRKYIYNKDIPVYYFAFGSNMSEEQFSERVSIPVFSREKGTLRGFELKFNKVSEEGSEYGYANIVPKNNSQVEGVLYLIPKSGIWELDKYEGF